MKKNEFNLFEKQQVLELKKLSSNSFHTMFVCIAPFSLHLESRIQGIDAKKKFFSIFQLVSFAAHFGWLRKMFKNHSVLCVIASHQCK